MEAQILPGAWLVASATHGYTTDNCHQHQRADDGRPTVAPIEPGEHSPSILRSRRTDRSRSLFNAGPCSIPVRGRRSCFDRHAGAVQPSCDERRHHQTGDRGRRQAGRPSTRVCRMVGTMKRFIRRNALGLVLVTTFLVVWLVGQTTTGLHVYNQQRSDAGLPTVGWSTYLTTAHFGEAVFESWKAEFLQDAVVRRVHRRFVQTARLREVQRPESQPQALDDEPRQPSQRSRRAVAGAAGRAMAQPVPELAADGVCALVQRVRLPCTRSAGAHDYSAEQAPARRDTTVSMLAYLGTERNSGSSRSRTGKASSWRWLAMVVLSIFLRHTGARPNPSLSTHGTDRRRRRKVRAESSAELRVLTPNGSRSKLRPGRGRTCCGP